MRAASLGKICASDRTVNAIDGMSALTHDFDAFTDARGAEYPTCGNWKKRPGSICGNGIIGRRIQNAV